VTILENVPLAHHTTLGVGGLARWFVETDCAEGALAAFRFARAQSVPYFILGGGSNLLVSDDGFPGVVVRMASERLEIRPIERFGMSVVEADAGVDWDVLVKAAVDKNAAGIECLAGIPGSVGGTPVQNVGAYGQDVSSVISHVDAIDLASEQKVSLSKAECGFSYRRSIFNTTHRGRYVIASVVYELQLDQPPDLAYRDVKQYFAERAIAHPSLAETAAAVREIRARKGMLLDPADPDSRSAGSFFKNPIVPAATVPRLAAVSGCPADQVPQFPAGAGHSSEMVKLSAAWLIERAGYHKGFRMGQAGISTKHTLALVNLGGASAAEIVALRDAVMHGVEQLFAIRLEQEPVTLGFPPSH
jgi:UDP-N-acetylmuramate dehydrogenase